MRHTRFSLLRNHSNFPSISIGEKIMVSYAFLMALYYLGDTTVGYIVPVIMTEHLKSPALMGLIFAFSSVIGLLIDVLLPQILPNKNYRFFTPTTFAMAILFPAAFLFLPASIWSFLLAMAIWGIHYELARFSNFSFIHQTLKPTQHDLGWGILQGAQSLVLLISPILAIYLLDSQKNLPFSASIIFFILGLVGYLTLKNSFLKKREVTAAIIEENRKPPSRFHEIAVWSILLKKIWPLYLFLLGLTMLDSAFWTVGALLSEQLKNDGFLGSLVITAYIFPSFFMAMIARKLAKPLGKKRTAFITALIGSLILAVGGLLIQGSLFVLVILTASFFLAVSYPEMYAVFEDFVSRLNHHGNDMVGLEGSATSIGYIVGPILAGGLSTVIGYQKTLAVFAIIFFIFALIALLMVPRKVRLPQKELAEIN